MVSSSLAPGRMPEGRRAYVVGDVHGCLDRLVSLHWQIARDLAAHPVRDSVLVHLGDYVDRGTDSAGVLWLLGGALAAPVTRRVDLRGNHELLMIDGLGHAWSGGVAGALVSSGPKPWSGRSVDWAFRESARNGASVNKISNFAKFLITGSPPVVCPKHSFIMRPSRAVSSIDVSRPLGG